MRTRNVPEISQFISYLASYNHWMIRQTGTSSTVRKRYRAANFHHTRSKLCFYQVFEVGNANRITF